MLLLISNRLSIIGVSGGKGIRFNGVVIGKDLSPYLIPREVTLTCSEEEKDKIWKSLLEETSSLPADDRLKIMRAFAILYWDWARECQHKHGDGDKKLTSGGILYLTKKSDFQSIFFKQQTNQSTHNKEPCRAAQG